MSKEVFFEGDAEVLPFTTPTTPTATLQKPSDVLDVPAAAPSTIWYLSITKPHVDSHDIIGPTKAFRHLLPRIEAIVSNSPTAIDKLAQLKETEDMWGETEPNEHFFNNGFEVFIVEGQRGSYTILKMIREINKSLIFFPRQCTRQIIIIFFFFFCLSISLEILFSTAFVKVLPGEAKRLCNYDTAPWLIHRASSR
ncbi:hypothetical protein CUC08_Gglean001417 [Alternaria sp. MG1]|nr:hypothetical protein CUC08_Gglean001417 [Alternaria sp. MG1]